MNYWFGKLNVPEMSGALACFLVAGLASETRIDNTEVKIHQALGIREPIIVVSIRPDDLPHTHLPYFFGG
jgi:hypothetical protein